jgi:hypothetical protein
MATELAAGKTSEDASRVSRMDILDGLAEAPAEVQL